MLQSSIFNNDTAVMISLIVCCLIVFATVMLPQAIRHRKKIKQNEIANNVPGKGQEIKTTIIPTEEMKSNRKQSFDYRDTFLIAPKIEDRKPVFLSKSTRDNLDKIVRRLGDRKMSVSGLIENMANHHLEEYNDEINKLYQE